MNGKENTIKAIQGLMGLPQDEQDGKIGPITRGAFEALSQSSATVKHAVIASSFADPADVRAFKKCKEEGRSDDDCFSVGDNAIGCWQDSTAEGTGPSCALPPEHIAERWGSKDAGRHKQVLVTHDNKEIICTLKDVMPHLAHLTTRARIDLNPDAVRALGMEVPIMAPVTWQWAT